MLDRAYYDARRFKIPCGATDKQVVRLGTATGKYHLRGLDPDRVRHLLPRKIDGAAGCRPGSMAAGRIAEIMLKIWQHRLQHGIVHRGCCVMVKICVGHHHVPTS